jgi:hypothetical protein
MNTTLNKINRTKLAMLKTGVMKFTDDIHIDSIGAVVTYTVKATACLATALRL